MLRGLVSTTVQIDAGHLANHRNRRSSCSFARASSVLTRHWTMVTILSTPSAPVNGKCGHVAASHTRQAFHRPLNILRPNIAAIADNEVLAAASNNQ